MADSSSGVAFISNTRFCGESYIFKSVQIILRRPKPRARMTKSLVAGSWIFSRIFLWNGSSVDIVLFSSLVHRNMCQSWVAWVAKSNVLVSIAQVTFNFKSCLSDFGDRITHLYLFFSHGETEYRSSQIIPSLSQGQYWEGSKGWRGSTAEGGKRRWQNDVGGKLPWIITLVVKLIQRICIIGLWSSYWFTTRKVRCIR